MPAKKRLTFEVTPGGCYVVISHKPNKATGYVEVWRNGVRESAHRIVYEECFGPLADGEVVRHRCDNRPCINPEHLLKGTHADNVADRQTRHRSARGSRQGAAKLDEDAVRLIRGTCATEEELARQLGVDPSLIGKIRRRELWRHVD